MNSWLRILAVIGLGIMIGGGIGLYLGWVVWPVQFVDGAPAGLQPNYQEDYLLMVAVAYTQDGDLELARRYMAGLGGESGQLLLRVTVEAILSGRAESDIRPLVALSQALGLESPAMAPYLPTDVQE